MSILYDAEQIENPAELGFKSQDWAARSEIVGFAEGRGTTFFVQHGGRDYVLRHYLRGGLIAKWLQDRYFWTGLSRTRAWQEWHMLAAMRKKKLPVPAPVAACVQLNGVFYRADIMTLRIPQARTLADILTQQPLDKGHWIALGAMLRRFHVHGVYHADLNANNILLDAGGCFYLIDFDRGCFKQRDKVWQQKNLARLHRSLDKIKAGSINLYFDEENWQDMLQGYESVIE
ncbi:MAG: 3-deoxy-D-manno-octulosonic acid kinase [Gammaproteobacteria bacterium]|nr:3-deoxy-D-manno-octulosonic acid kinase [Gammaproteobacteria bacterium]